ncbi:MULTISPECIES: winged helix-turn-helix transcriptional regulator [Kordiimonas]|jgi:DNA-binding HxlR family transcriptional regulator|uniref:winged helix-turn-helix transcriptional regulator n=1 Tax=Kordiimonas TaxID=288021 RepID=UPI00257A4B63|nr:helix-turn-helix domain-containing protein [Kordiimonas sp. UBA4487]
MTIFMDHNSENCRSNCPINFVLETFGDKWTLLIVRDLMFKGKRYYGDFLASDEKIATNILADRLKRLERHGIIAKAPDASHKSKAIYSLTDKGKDLLPVMLEITAWSAKYDSHSNTSPSFLEAFTKDRAALIASFKAGIDQA